MRAVEPSDLAVSVERAIINDQAYQPHGKIDVVAENGVVTLGGVIAKAEDRQKDEIDVDPGLRRHPEDQHREDKLEVEVPRTDMFPLAGQ